MERLDLRRGESQGVDEALCALPVARDETKRNGAILARLRQAQSNVRDDEGVETFRNGGEREGAAFSKTVDGRPEQAGGWDELIHVRCASLAKASRGARHSRANKGVS